MFPYQKCQIHCRSFSLTTEELRVKENTEISMQQAELQLIDCHPSLDNSQQTTVAAGKFLWSRKAVPKSHKVHSLYFNLSAKQPEIDVPLLPMLGLHKLVAVTRDFLKSLSQAAFLVFITMTEEKESLRNSADSMADLCLRQSRTNSPQFPNHAVYSPGLCLITPAQAKVATTSVSLQHRLSLAGDSSES